MLQNDVLDHDETGVNDEWGSDQFHLEKHLFVCLGDSAAIKLFPARNGGTFVRVIKHRRSEDLFPAEFVVERRGAIRVHRHHSKRGSIVSGRYDFEVHVDAEYTELLQVIDWGCQSLSEHSSLTTLCPENDVACEDLSRNLRTGIFIKYENGDVREYTNDKIELRVVSYDVVDENGTGIFEPGEFFRVKNVKIRNMGTVHE